MLTVYLASMPHKNGFLLRDHTKPNSIRYCGYDLQWEHEKNNVTNLFENENSVHDGAAKYFGKHIKTMFEN